jgi:TRAP-type C4-dicarboxylate transport system permease small subunit
MADSASSSPAPGPALAGPAVAPRSPLARGWDALVRGLEVLVIVLFALLVLDVVWGVASRYTPGIRPSDWTEELAIHLLLWISLLGAALGYRCHAHLGVDFFVGKFDPAVQTASRWVAEAAVFLFSAFALVFGGGRLVAETLAAGQVTSVLGWRAGYVYAAVPLCGVFICAFVIEHLVRPAAVTPAPEKDV